MSKKLTAVALGVMVFAMVSASAAGLGGTTTGAMGAEADIVAACDTTGVTVDFTTAWDGTAGEFVVTDVVLTDLGDTAANECDGQSATVSVSAAGTEIGSGAVTVSGASATVAPSGE
jgi:hypothetical protein